MSYTVYKDKDEVESHVVGYLTLRAKNTGILIDQDGTLVHSCEGCFFEDLDYDCQCPNEDERYIWSTDLDDFCSVNLAKIGT